MVEELLITLSLAPRAPKWVITEPVLLIEALHFSFGLFKCSCLSKWIMPEWVIPRSMNRASCYHMLISTFGAGRVEGSVRARLNTSTFHKARAGSFAYDKTGELFGAASLSQWAGFPLFSLRGKEIEDM
jgi:hypothetical protein